MDPFAARRLALRLIAAAAVAALAACGRKADPRPPADADPRAPRVYPADRSVPPDERLRRDEIPRVPPPTEPTQPTLPPQPYMLR